MGAFNKLPGFQRSPPGLERRILRSLPRLLVAATLVPLLCTWLVRRFPSPTPGQPLEQYFADIDILATSFVVTAWTAAFTVAIGCVIVMVMKGPAYVADRYHLPDAEHPGQTDRSRDRDAPPPDADDA